MSVKSFVSKFSNWCSVTMLSGKTVKLVLYEVLQFAALVVPVFVIMERFASLMHNLKRGNETVYWLVVAASIAYVTSATLLVWVPLKYITLKRRSFSSDIRQWRPILLVYIFLCTFPCFAILIVSSKVQVDRGRRLDHFTELPVSLVLFSLICVDIIERIRPCRLLGRSDSLDPDFDMSGPVLTHLQHVSTVTKQLYTNEDQNALTLEARNGSSPGGEQDLAASPGYPTPRPRTPRTSYLYSSSSCPPSHPGRLGFLWRRDTRAEMFVASFMFWFDTVEMVRVAGEPLVFYSVWVFPVYILALMSTLRMVITPNNPLLSFAGFVLQDLPFFILRVALIAVFGYVSPVLYLLKNVLVSLTFIYFTLLTRLRIFKRQTMF